MSIRIALENPPEFYTNLDIVKGRVILNLNRVEAVGAIIAKLEGESKTALSIPNNINGIPGRPPLQQSYNSGSSLSLPTPGVVHENHKILYKVAQVYPPPESSHPGPVYLPPGHHEFPFEFKVPFNNACSDTTAMARIGGVGGLGGVGPAALLGLGGIRVMDGSRQLMYAHTTKTLPPSFTGFPGMAEIRYFIKITIQRLGLFRENWRYQIGWKFLPLEPPRPEPSNREGYARRPFAFQARKPPASPLGRKHSSIFGGGKRSSSAPGSPSIPGTPTGEGSATPSLSPATAPSIEMSARLPHPSILTCLQPIPLRLISKKQSPSAGKVVLVALQIDLVGLTHVRAQDLVHTETSRWVVVSRQGLSVPVSLPDDPIDKETVLPDSLWSDVPLPNTVMPSFLACNVTREYQLEIKLGLSWLPDSSDVNSNNPFFPSKGKGVASVAQEIHLPLHFSAVDVYSGVAPPPQLVEAMRRGLGRKPGKTQVPGTGPSLPLRPQPQPNRHHGPLGPSGATGPPLPARHPQQQQAQQPHDPLYPPQLRPGQTAPSTDDAPPSYDEAMAEMMTGPVLPAGGQRPGYSGETNENGPSTLPEKS